ncbi:hypothetical protein Geu3261_0351_019 [Komagataeibacter europaeus NBRC 3261]|uniref:Uncharacterized protein n=1 Tax=Komagataeibacter europaeus NBRC 3261 TaxID=1234669 RepID=A0A0D6Q332_KOMEU|nr:hypothetical protein [Komagataeibacter europaeus]GAN97977.1 hypothetical protein Geu3261_0351_019 [Komagataeibacter europaeus NBRC 3261]
MALPKIEDRSITELLEDIERLKDVIDKMHPDKRANIPLDLHNAISRIIEDMHKIGKEIDKRIASSEE